MFHDAPLHSFDCDPAARTIDLVVQLFEVTREVDAHGYYRTTNNHLVHFRFSGVADVTLRQFDVPNTLLEMRFSPAAAVAATGRFTVDLASVLGGDCSAQFSAASAKSSA